MGSLYSLQSLRIVPRHLGEYRWRLRYRVSMARQRLGTVFLILIVISFGWYTYSTRDAAICRRAIAFLEKNTADGVEIVVKSATFGMFDSITLRDVRISVPFDEQLDPHAVDSQSRTIFSAKSLELIHNPWQLLLGNLKIDRIIAVQPTIILAQNAETRRRNWQLLFGDVNPETIRSPASRPIVTLRSAKAIVESIDRSGRHISPPEKLDVDVRPNSQTKTGYWIEMRRYTDPIERTTVLFDPGERLVANTPFIDARTVGLQLPRPAQQLFESLSLAGEVRLSRLLYDATTPKLRDTEIELRHVRCQIPLWLLDQARSQRGPEPHPQDRVPAEENLLTMTDVRGMFHLKNDLLQLDVSGLINGAPCTVTGDLDHVYGDYKQMGVHLSFHGDRLPTPEGVIRDRLLTHENMYRPLSMFLNDYQPHGAFDIDFNFVHPFGSERSLIVTGVLRPQDVQGRCRWFPYPVDHLVGQIRFEGDHVVNVDLRGSHDAGMVTVQSTIDLRTKPARADVNIRGNDIPLDDTLFHLLPAHHRSAWHRLLPGGSMNVDVHLHRHVGRDNIPQRRWEKSIDVELRDSSAILFPVTPGVEDHASVSLEKLQGHLRIEDDQIKLDGLVGHSRGASVRFDGDVSLKPSKPPSIDLFVSAKHLQMDESTQSVLPSSVREMIERFHPSGAVDLSGSVSNHENPWGLKWTVRAQVHDASIRYESFPFLLEALSGECSISPEGLSNIKFTASHGEARIQALGGVRHLDRGYVTDLSFKARSLSLDKVLYAALPPAMKQAWDLLQPEGRVHVRAGLHIDTRGESALQRLRTEIEPLNAKLQFRNFPLPLSSVTGKVIVTQDHVEILSLLGKTDGGAIEISGKIERSPPGQRGSLMIDATNMTFQSSLFKAMPEALRSFLLSLSPHGHFDLRLDPLRFEMDDSGHIRWFFDGQLHLADVSADLGFPLKHCTGLLTLHGRINHQGKIDLDVKTDLQEADLAGWRFQNLQAQISINDAGKIILVQEVSGNLYEGQASGSAEVTWGHGPTEYQASITLRDVQLNRYLQSQTHGSGPIRPGDPDRQTARGTLFGNLVLRGHLGRGGFREGMGEVMLSRAQVWKLPLIFAIFQVLNLTPDENVFHDGQVKFFLNQDKLIFQKIDLQGKAMSFIGGGRYDLRSRQLDITLLAGSPIRIHVPLLTEILERASREIMEVRVTGTLEKPTIRPQPLKSLAAAFKSLFPALPSSLHGRPISKPDD